MVRLDILNSRMKDFFDVWLLSRRFNFDGATLSDAITATFAQRNTEIPLQPVALSSTFAEDSAKLTQWRAFLRKQQLEQYAPLSLAETIQGIDSFLGPVTRALVSSGSFRGVWPPSGPWQ
jgi:hypothetical protein